MSGENTTTTTEQPKAKLQAVRFTKNYNCYNEGEVASFTEQHADFLVKRRIAERVTLPKEEEDDVAKSNAAGAGQKNPELPQNRQTTGTSSKQK